MPRTFLQIIHEFSIQTYFFMQYPRSTKNRSNNLFIGILHQGIGVIYVAEIFTWTQGGYPRPCMGENGAKIITPQSHNELRLYHGPTNLIDTEPDLYINKLKYIFNDADKLNRLSDFIITAMRNRVRWKAVPRKPWRLATLFSHLDI